MNIELSHQEIHALIHALSEKKIRSAVDDELLKKLIVIDEAFNK